MLVVEVPAAWPYQQGGRTIDELVVPAVGGVVGDGRVDGVDQVEVALHLVAPGGAVRVLEVGHETAGPRVERVDDHLPVGRPGDLDPAVRVVVAGWRDLPVGVADVCGVGQEAGRRGPG